MLKTCAVLSNIQGMIHTFLGVEVDLYRGVATGVEDLAGVDFQDGHGAGSVLDRNPIRREQHRLDGLRQRCRGVCSFQA